MNNFAVLDTDFEHLSYQLGKCAASDKATFHDRSQHFMLHKVSGREHAESIFCSSDWLCEHASEPVGFVENGKREFFIICRISGKRGAKSHEGGLKDSIALVRRLAHLHTQGFGCGGIPAMMAEYSGRGAKLLDPSSIFALADSDSIFHEAVSTICSLVKCNHAKKEDIGKLSNAYASFSPVCRADILASKKPAIGTHYASPAAILADAALRTLAYF